MRRSFLFPALLSALAALHVPARAALDIGPGGGPGDGVPDVWAAVTGYTGDGASLSADSDGDGQTNGAEAAAGTNPNASGDVIAIKSLTPAGANLKIDFPGIGGKKYQMQSSPTLSPANFTNVPQAAGTVVATADANIQVTLPMGAGSKYYRVVVSDIDTDSDGLTDYEERKIGLNPLLPDIIGGLSGVAYVSGQLALPDVVTVVATDATASEDGSDFGSFMVERTRNLFTIDVPYTVSGTATPGVDYQSLGGSVHLMLGENTASFNIVPTSEPTNVVESGESVTVTLANPSLVYSLGTPSSATVIIGETTATSGTGLMARYYDTASGNYSRPENFGTVSSYTYTRLTAATGTATIAYTATPALSVGHQVNVAFTAGNLNNVLYSPLLYTVTGVTPTNFTVAIAGTALPTNQTTASSCVISITSFPHPAVITQVDPTVNFDWQHGTPNGVVILPNNSPDNYSASWDAYLQPTTAGNYIFQLDADDKARVLLDTGAGLVQILEHGWDGPATIGTFKQSAPIALSVPGSPSARYHIRVEHVETTGNARCRLQWSANGGTTFANIAQANQFTHTQAITYSYTQATGDVVVTPTGGHLFVGGEVVNLTMSSGNLFLPISYSGPYTITAVSGTSTFTVNITGTGLPATGTGSGFLENAASTTTGLFNRTYANTAFTSPPGRVGVDAAVTTGNNGIWNTGTPDVNLIRPETFSVRWTGQVQPQFSEEYTLVVGADDGCALRINGQSQILRTIPSASTSGSTYLYDAGSGNAVVSYPALIVSPGSFIVGESVRLDPSSGSLSHAPASPPTYRFDDVTGDVVINYANLTNVTPGGFVVGETIELDPTSGSLSALGLLPYTITAATANTITVNSGGLGFNPRMSVAAISVGPACEITTVQNHGLSVGSELRISSVATGIFSPDINSLYTVVAVVSPTKFTVASNCTVAPTAGTGVVIVSGNIAISDNRNAVITAATPTTFTVNMGANKYANASAGNVSIDIVNKPLKDWSSSANERFVHVPMIGGVRYDIQLDYYESTSAAKCQLSWYSPSQPRQIIPSNRLYPTSTPASPLAPPILLSPTSAVALVGGAFSYAVVGSNGATVTVSGNPAWLTYSGGVLSGTPPPGTAGHYQIVVTTTGPAGTGMSVIELDVQDTGGVIAREYWNGVEGTTIATIPTGAVPTGSGDLSQLAAPTDFGDNYGARIRGYITAPVTGNYYFWISASNAAELWIANDDEPINTFKRASVTTGNTTPQTWVGEANQKSAWLALEAGQRYYIEILHKAGSGAGDNLAVGWLKPGESGALPSEVVPGYVLSPYVAPSLQSIPGTLYVATMLSQNGAATSGVGTSTLRLSADETTVIMGYSYRGLTGPITSQHIHTDPYLLKPSEIVFDIDTPETAGDGLILTGPDAGKYKWTIKDRGSLTAPEIREIIKQGKAYINLHTAMFPAGEIRGNYTLANGSRLFTPPPAPPALADDHATNNGASRFLTQATFGPNPADIAALKAMASYDAWINDQFTRPVSYTLPEVIRTENASAQGAAFDETLAFNAWWKSAVSAPDQLRQRIAYALSQIHVVSAQGPLDNRAEALAYYYDHLVNHAFGNFRDLLQATTLTPAMGRYLDMKENDKPDLTVGRIPNENYAREILQLFDLGLFRLWPDGTLMLNSKDELIPTYTQREIVGFAHLFTGWDDGYDGAFRTTLGAATNYTRPMREVPARHFTGPKRVLNNEVLPGLQQLGGQPLDPYATHNATQFNDPSYQALPGLELAVSHQQLFEHPNVGPFICRQLIQRMVMSNPSRDYLYRVVQKFNNNGAGVRGDLKAVIKAILLDYEARSSSETTKPIYGKQREPVLRVAAAGRAFRQAAWTGTYTQSASPSSTSRTITVSTSTAHKLVTGNNVFLDFSDTTGDVAKPAPWIGTYSATVTGNNTFTVQANGWATGTYNIPANSTVCTVSMGSHWLEATEQAYFDFTSGPADGLAGFDNTVHPAVTSNASNTVAGTTFTITVPTSASARSGNVMIPRFAPGSYTTSASGLAAPRDRRVTMDTNFDHHLKVGDQVQINFFQGNPLPVDMVATVESVVDMNTWTFLAPSLGTNLGTNQGNNNVYQFPLLAQPLTRSGTVGSRPSTFNMGNTEGDMDQAPLNSPTVFNFYLPDYKFPGALASQGITTPEFQETAETSVIRQANFLERGIYALGNTNGVSSFKNGTNALVMDLSPWMANAVGTVSPGLELGAGTSTTRPWTHDQNLSVLIDRFSTVLLGAALPAAVKTQITTFVQTRTNMGSAYNQFTNPYTNIPYNNSGTTTATDPEKTNRIRAILHLILTSPDFTIQR